MKHKDPSIHQVELTKHGATWYYFTTNPQGGGFGSNNCGPQYIARARALHCLPPGTPYGLTVNGKYRGLNTK